MTPPVPVLLAFGFSNLAMLGWLAAAAAPLLIHLWSRHRFREAPWAAMQFLLAAMRKNARRMHVQQWLLLAVRTLLIALVVLAVAEPYGEELVAGGSASGPAHKVLVLDGSYSMAYRGEAGTSFEQAKKLAARLVRNSRSGDTLTVILMSVPARTIVDRNTLDHSAVAAQIESLPPTHTNADLAAALSLVEEAIAEEGKARTSAVRQEVYFFTDLQRTTWHIAGSQSLRGDPLLRRSRDDDSNASRATHSPAAPGVEDFRPRAERGNEEGFAALAERAAVAVIDVGQPRAANLAVTRLTTPEPFVTVDRPVTFEATLHQFGDPPLEEFMVELLVDDVSVAEQTVDVPAGGDASVRFTHRFRSPGSYALTVRAAGDRLPIDNRRWLVVPVREAIRVLLVAGREGAADYLVSALHPGQAAASAIRPVIVSDGDLAELELADYDCVFLCNVAQLTPGEAQRLWSYVARGGGIVTFLGDRVMPEAYNAIAEDGRASDEPPATVSGSGLRFANPQQSNPRSAIGNPQSERGLESVELPLLPARVGSVIVQSQFGLDPLDYRHPIVAPFRGRERAGLLTTPITRYYELEIPSDRRGVEVVAATRDGHPFIVAAPLGRGRTVVVATAGSLSSVDADTGEPWTTWPTWPSFLPLVREMLAYAAGGQADQWQQPVGATLAGPLAEGFPSPHPSELEMLRPDGRTAPVSVQTDPGAMQWSYSATDLSGMYSLRGTSQQSGRQFAVNVDATEGDLAKVDPPSLPAQVVVRETAQVPAGQRTSRVLSHAAWHEHLLWIALVLLFVESLMAWQFGRGAA